MNNLLCRAFADSWPFLQLDLREVGPRIDRIAVLMNILQIALCRENQHAQILHIANPHGCSR